jgi:hypothetical protein
MAAVSPAGPDPMMTTSLCSVSFVMVFLRKPSFALRRRGVRVRRGDRL